MGRMTEPVDGAALGIQDPQPSRHSVGDTFIQAVSLMLGYHQGKRIQIQASPSGVMRTSSGALTDVLHLTASGANQNKQGDRIPASEVLCMAHPDNAGRVWVRTRKAATSSNAFPLDAGDVTNFSVDNLDELRALIVTSGDTLIVGYTQ